MLAFAVGKRHILIAFHTALCYTVFGNKGKWDRELETLLYAKKQRSRSRVLRPNNVVYVEGAPVKQKKELWVEDAEPKYRKEAKKSSPPKAKHRHEYENCVFQCETESYIDDTARKLPTHTMSIGSFCPICGKVETVSDARWRSGIHYKPDILDWLKEWSPEAIAQFDEKTRTLPMFLLTGKHLYFTKSVDLSTMIPPQATEV